MHRTWRIKVEEWLRGLPYRWHLRKPRPIPYPATEGEQADDPGPIRTAPLLAKVDVEGIRERIYGRTDTEGSRMPELRQRPSIGKYTLAGVVVAVAVVVVFVVGRAIVHAVTRHHATSGRVVDANFEPTHDWIYMQPIPHTLCVPVTIGKTTTEQCTTTYTYIPVPMHDPDKWSLRVNDGEAEDWVTVSEAVYTSCRAGGDYPGEGRPCS